MLCHPNNGLCLPPSPVGTVPVFTWTLQIFLWQKRQRETWMDSARCGVCMKSGSKALQRRPSKTGSHSGRGNTASRLFRNKFRKCHFLTDAAKHLVLLGLCLIFLEIFWCYSLLVYLLVVTIDRTWCLIVLLCVFVFTGVKPTYLRSFCLRGRTDFGSWNSRRPCLWNCRRKWINTRSRPKQIFSLQSKSFA